RGNITPPPRAPVDPAARSKTGAGPIASRREPVETGSPRPGHSRLAEVPAASNAEGMINLEPRAERDVTVSDVMRELQEKTAHIADAEIEFFPPPTVPGFGNASGFELRLLDRSGNEDLNQTAEVVEDFITALNNSEAIEGVSSSFDVSFP